MSDAQKLFREREKLIEDTIRLRPTVRVPNCARVNYWPFYEYGLSIADSMKDFGKANECFYRFHREFSPDVASYGTTALPSRVYELVGCENVRWAGDPKGLPEDAPFQFMEYETLGEDEYDEFLGAPLQFTIDKYLPRVAQVFEPLRRLNCTMIASGITTYINEFTSPDMLDMYRKLLECGELLAEQRRWSAEAKRVIMDMGYPFISGTGGSMAFDMLGDCMRGTFGIMSDLVLQPEQIRRTLDGFVRAHIESSLMQCRMTGSRYAWVMLHKGFDHFIGDDTYAEFYWPYLKQWILAMIDHDLTPVVFAEGSYTTRLKYLADVPEGKVVYYFEEVDLEACRRTLGGHSCIMGAFPSIVLTNGTPAQIRDKVKETISILAADGGYLFAVSCGIDRAPRANMEAMFDAVEQFGKY